MEIIVKDKSSFQKELEVTLSPQDMEPYLEHAAQALGAGLSLKGFRPGKAPIHIVKEVVGEGKIWEEAAEQAVEKSFFQACKDNNIEIIASPRVEIRKLAPGNDVVYSASVEVVPEIHLGDWRAAAKQIREKEHRDVRIEEKEIADTLGWLADSRATYVAQNRPANMGDYVEVSYEGRIGGVVQEGLQMHRDSFILGKGTVDENFEKNMEGMQRGEQKEFSVVLSPEHPLAHVRGKEVQFRATLENVQERNVPAVDDAFAQSLGKFQTLAELQDNVREGMVAEKQQKEKERVLLLILKEIAQKSHIEVPPSLLGAELDKMKEEFGANIEGMGLDFSTYLGHIKKTEEEVRSGWQEKAKERVEAGLVLRALGKEEKIEPDEAEVTKRASAYIARYKNAKEAELHEGAPDELRARVKAMLRNEKVMELLLAN